MAKKICFTNQKGGVGKTASAQHLIAYLSKKGKRVLAIDLDPQCNLTMMFGIDSVDYEAEGTAKGQTVYNLFRGKAAKDVIIKIDGIDFIVGSNLMALAEGEFSGVNAYYILSEALELIENQYDFIIIDTPPTIGVLTINALTYVDGLIIPYKADSLSKAGVVQLYDTLKSIRKRMNPKLKVYGVLITMFDTRTRASKKSLLDAEEVAQLISAKVFQVKIRQSARMRELMDLGKTIFDVAKDNIASKDYMDFCEELLKEIN